MDGVGTRVGAGARGGVEARIGTGALGGAGAGAGISVGAGAWARPASRVGLVATTRAGAAAGAGLYSRLFISIWRFRLSGIAVLANIRLPFLRLAVVPKVACWTACCHTCRTTRCPIRARVQLKIHA